jgi:hypothetical protein
VDSRAGLPREVVVDLDCCPPLDRPLEGQDAALSGKVNVLGWMFPNSVGALAGRPRLPAAVLACARAAADDHEEQRHTRGAGAGGPHGARRKLWRWLLSRLRGVVGGGSADVHETDRTRALRDA